MIKKLLTAAALALSFTLGACGGTLEVREARQENADNIFGDAKNGLLGLQILVSLYALAPECGKPGSPTPPFCYSQAVAIEINKAILIAGETIEATEKVFADANSEGDARMARAKAANSAIRQLALTLAKYGIRKDT